MHTVRNATKFRMVGRAVECGGLENRCGGNSTGGSNPSPSARNNKDTRTGVFVIIGTLIIFIY